MKHHEDNFIGVGDVKLFYQVWRPDKTTKAVIQLIHGFLEHGGRYTNVVNELIPRRICDLCCRSSGTWKI